MEKAQREISEISPSQFKEVLQSEGWIVLDSVLSPGLISRLLSDLDDAYRVCRSVQIKNGVDKDTQLTVHHLIGLGESFLEFIDTLTITEHVEAFFEGKFILNSFGGAINSANSVSYAHRIHRDIRSFSGDMPLLLNTLLMLDDFTPQNGATYLMPGSHRFAEKPAEEAFYKTAKQALGKAGSILVFNYNTWHAGGNNQTNRARRSLTPMYSKPFMKAQYDYPRALGYDHVGKLSDNTRQILGYNSRVPANLDEWYQPPEKRMYLPDQG